jgi:hypothetical protein
MPPNLDPNQIETPNIERRSVTIRELRASADGEAMRIGGYAAVFGELSDDLGGFREMLVQGCFTNALKTSDVRCLFNHDPSQVMGRLAARTLRLKEDLVGLHFECDLPDTQAARDLLVSIKRGDVSQCSFGFGIDYGDNGATDWIVTNDTIIRKVVRVKELFDVSPVTYPAYPQTTVSAEARARCTQLQQQHHPNARQVAAAEREQHRQAAVAAMRTQLQLAEAF